MSNRLKKLQRYHERLAAKHAETEKEGVIENTWVRGAMWYQCEQCGERWLMYLEVGLGDHSENHKPVPFMIRCGCGGTARHVDWNKDIWFDGVRPLLEGASYFKNTCDSDCGVPVLKGGVKP
ncbi:MAG: hypothetical protein IKW21_05225 [Lachnospiraceae bacterium]|nr:hypothetical protein [Lachnospiraceae bacterium]